MKIRLYSLQILLFVILLNSTTNSFGQVDLEQGLVGYFPFEGNANDESNLNINSTVNNATLTTGINGDSESAYSFNGVNTNINCGLDYRDISDTVTVSTWFKATSSEHSWIVGKYNYTIDKGFHIGIKNGYIYLGGRNNSGEYTSIYSLTLINDGNWHHVIGIINSNTWELWVDCQLEGITYSNSVNPDLTSQEPLTIGNYNLGEASSGPGLFFSGSIDEVRIYNRVLSNDEKERLCNNIMTANISTVKEINISIYPNPAKFSLFIDAKKEDYHSIEIFDISGSKLKTYQQTKEIDISNFNSGIYFIRIVDKNGKTLKLKKIIKVNEFS